MTISDIGLLPDKNVMKINDRIIAVSFGRALQALIICVENSGWCNSAVLQMWINQTKNAQWWKEGREVKRNWRKSPKLRVQQPRELHCFYDVWYLFTTSVAASPKAVYTKLQETARTQVYHVPFPIAFMSLRKLGRCFFTPFQVGGNRCDMNLMVWTPQLFLSTSSYVFMYCSHTRTLEK